jgi:hypothetical protein
VPTTPDIVQASYHAPSGTLRGMLQPQSYDRRLLKITFTNAPLGSSFTLYRGYNVEDSTAMTTTLIGSRNSYDAGRGSAPIELFAGEAATLVWSGSAAIIAGVTATAAVVSEWGNSRA